MFGFGKKKTVKEEIEKIVEKADLPTIVKNDLRSAFLGMNFELKNRLEFDQKIKNFDGTKESLVEILELFILAKSAEGLDVSRLVSVVERIRGSQAV